MYYQRLDQTEQDKLHHASLEVMRNSGVRFLEKNAIEIFRKAGCAVQDNLVRFPSNLVEWALKTCPKNITLFDRLGQPKIHLMGRCAYYGNGSDLLYIIDHETCKCRSPLLKDVKDIVTLIDALPHFDFSMSGFIPTDVPNDQVQRWQMKTMLENTIKPIVYVTTDFENTKSSVEMAEIVAGDEKALRENPFAVNYINISNPLKHNTESVRKLMWLSQKGLPFVYRPSIVTRGISTPVTWAGFLVVNNVAGLAGLVLSQLVREGALFIRCGCSGGTFDMQTMVGLHSAAEIRGFNEDLCEYYQIPRFGIGGLSGSKDVDQQAAYEAALTLITSTQAGAQLIHDVGYLDNGRIGALDHLVICHEIIGWVKQYMKDMVIDEESLALELIHQVIQSDTNFLDSDHTLAHYQEDYYPALTDRSVYDTWEAKGSTTLRERAKKEADAILKDHRAVPLEKSVPQKLLDLINREAHL
ncbi:MAG: trimethylamine methyltransferase family protein [Bacillota bacterium]|nr:trimethylamine methyltransferase family protein [Bacillota bacterium]